MSSPLLSPDEDSVLQKLAEAWNEFLKLDTLHPDEQTEFRHAIHSAQHIIMSRPVARQQVEQPAQAPELAEQAICNLSMAFMEIRIAEEVKRPFKMTQVEDHYVLKPRSVRGEVCFGPVTSTVKFNEALPSVIEKFNALCEAQDRANAARKRLFSSRATNKEP